jgi:hypothetical protein
MVLYQPPIEYLYARLIFGLQQRHNPNMSILSPGDSFAERVLFWVLLLEKIKKGIELFACSAIKHEIGL